MINNTIYFTGSLHISEHISAVLEEGGGKAGGGRAGDWNWGTKGENGRKQSNPEVTSDVAKPGGEPRGVVNLTDSSFTGKGILDELISLLPAPPSACNSRGLGRDLDEIPQPRHC